MWDEIKMEDSKGDGKVKFTLTVCENRWNKDFGEVLFKNIYEAVIYDWRLVSGHAQAVRAITRIADSLQWKVKP